MALSAQQQVRHAYVGLDYPAHANVQALQAGTRGDLACLSADGSAVAAGEPFVLLKKTAEGDVTSPKINPANVLYSKSVAHVAQTGKVVTFDAVAVPVAGVIYTATVGIQGYGSLSAEDEYLKKGFYKAAAGDDAEAVVDGLVASLIKNFSREIGADATGNDYFAFSKSGTGAAAKLVVTEKVAGSLKYYKVGKKSADHVEFWADLTNTNDEVVAQTVTGGLRGVGTGMQVADMEWYLIGERADFYREAGYPHNIDTDLDAAKAASYNLIEIGYYDEGRDEAKKSKKQVTIAMPFTNLAGNATINLLIADLNTILGAGSIDALAIV